MMRGSQTPHLLPGSGNTSKMPSDKHGQHHNNSPLISRPLMPKISASTKTGRAPLTPRIAGSTTSTRSPVLRRTAGPPPAETTPKSISTPKDGISTPVQAFLSSNITPRSSSRKGRVDSAGNTPTGTPSGTPTSSRPTSTLDATSLLVEDDLDHETGLGIGGLGEGSGPGPRSTVADNNGTKTLQSPLGNNWPSFTEAPNNASASPDHVPADSSPMFFFASDAKSVPNNASKPLPARPGLQTKTSSFFYANDPVPPSSSGPSTVVSPASTSDSSQGKFFQVRTATAQPTTAAVPASMGSHGSGSAPKRAALAQRPHPYTVVSPSWHPQQQPPQPHRSPSPSRDAQSPFHPALKSTTVPGSPRAIRAMPSSLSPTRSPSTGSSTSRANNTSRDASASACSTTTVSPQRQVSHKRSISMVSQEAAPAASEPFSDPRSPTSTTYALTSPSPLLPSATTTTTTPSSPTKSSAGADAVAASAAHQARRERKVLDLEISNSSLLAINRTLEREMRKQNAELRRFRRLSRSGRLSLASRGAGRRSTLATTTEEESNLSDMSASPTTSDEEDEDDEDEDDYLSSTTTSPSSLTSASAKDARRMMKDETRLKLDLQKHQQLLVDSQKMNQSLKRCLGWTEELIKDGKKALEYTVRVSEVAVGGRVLGPEEVEEEEQEEGESEDVREAGGEHSSGEAMGDAVPVVA